VVIDDLDPVGSSAAPLEADSPLLVDPDAVLAGTVPGQFLEPVPGWNSEIVEVLGRVQQQKLAERDPSDRRRESTGPRTFKDLPGIGVSKGPNHRAWG